jgi:hypothetical protein
MAGAGYKLFQTGDVLTAAQVNTYLNEQTVMVFASAAARTSALTSVLAEGMVSYLQDTNAVEVYDGSAWVSIGASGDITGITTGTDSGLSGGVTSGTATLRLKLEFDAETGTTYTLLAANLNQLVTLNNASAITLTVPPSVFSAGDVINIAQIGAGQVTLSQGAGVTINSTGATATAPKLRARYSAASIICTASNTFLVVGDIA